MYCLGKMGIITYSKCEELKSFYALTDTVALRLIIFAGQKLPMIYCPDGVTCGGHRRAID
jgi:hypothetical protein